MTAALQIVCMLERLSIKITEKKVFMFGRVFRKSINKTKENPQLFIVIGIDYILFRGNLVFAEWNYKLLLDTHWLCLSKSRIMPPTEKL